MNKDLLYFNLKSVDGGLGYEKSRSDPTNVDGVLVVTIVTVINTYFDLILDRPTEFSLVVPVGYHMDGCIIVKSNESYGTSLLRAMKPCPIDDSNVIRLPGLDRVKYPFAVWFYAMRELFKVPRLKPWGSAVLLREEFQNTNLDWPNYNKGMELKMYHGSGRTRGRRDYMEDVDLAFSSLKLNDRRSISVFGVLDGHGGKECAQFCSEDIPIRIAANMRNGLGCPEALFRAFLDSDQEYLDSPACGGAGSTANVAVYDKQYNVFYTANTGDTRAVLSRRGVALDLSFDRKGSDPEEMARVARAGGFVVKGRLMGTLAVSRALGDISLKEQGAQSLQRVLIPDPELSALYPTRDDDFILIATDGLWDVMSSQAAVDHARNLLVQEGLLGAAADIDSLGEDTVSTRLSQVANNMAVHAVSNLSSQDNVTVLIILLSGGPAGYPPVFENRPALKQGKVASPFSTSSAAAQNIGYTRQGDEKETFSSRSTRSEDIFVSASPDAASPDWSRPTVVFRHSNATLTTAREFSGDIDVDSGSSRSGGLSSKSAAAVAAPRPVAAAKAAPDPDLDDMMDFLNDDSNF